MSYEIEKRCRAPQVHGFCYRAALRFNLPLKKEVGTVPLPDLRRGLTEVGAELRLPPDWGALHRTIDATLGSAEEFRRSLRRAARRTREFVEVERRFEARDRAGPLSWGGSLTVEAGELIGPGDLCELDDDGRARSAGPTFHLIEEEEHP